LIDAVLLSRGSDQRLAAAYTIVAPSLIDARHLHGEAATQFGALDDVKRGTLAASRRGERDASTRGKTRGLAQIRGDRCRFVPFSPSALEHATGKKC
jgi:hypothetical protein